MSDRRRSGFDGMSKFLALHWEDPNTTRMEIRPELINGGGILSGVATYGMIDYTMGSALWREKAEEEAIATLNNAINYVQTALEGELVCRAEVDRRNRTSAVLRATVEHADGRLMATAVGSYSIFRKR